MVGLFMLAILFGAFFVWFSKQAIAWCRRQEQRRAAQLPKSAPQYFKAAMETNKSQYYSGDDEVVEQTTAGREEAIR